MTDPYTTHGANLCNFYNIKVNRPNDVPLNSPSIRGDVNSVLLLEPDGPKSTKFFYVIEINANGNSMNNNNHMSLRIALFNTPSTTLS